MPGTLEIKVLGDFQVMREGEPVELPPSRKTRALLAYLAVDDRPHQRERLCDMFWDLPDDPKGSLRWSLSRLRHVLGADGEMLAADRNAVTLRITEHVDYFRVKALFRGTLRDASIDVLEATEALFGDGFLADLSLGRCPEFEAWRRSRADEIELLHVRLLREILDRRGDEPELALRSAMRLRHLLPDNEEVAREADAFAAAARGAAARARPDSRSDAAPYAEAAPAAHDREIRFFKAQDGVRIAYSVIGHGPPIVRAAHWMSHLRYDWESPIWRHWIAALSANNTLLRYDERCNGLSDWAVDDISFEAMLSDLEGVIEAAGLERFTLLGISQSCALSVAYAVRHPERVTGLILYGGYVKGWRKRGDPRETATRHALATLLREGWGKDNQLFRQLFSSMFIRGAGPEHIAWIDELQRRTVSPENAWRLQNVFADIDVSELLSQVAVPTLVVHAREDAVAPVSSGRQFATNIPGARFIELDSANHILLEQEPAFEEFMASLRSFIGETGRKARG